jgi:fibronectin type 3 domain-containing protein
MKFTTIVRSFVLLLFIFVLFTGQNIGFAEVQYTQDLIPKMTSNTTPSGVASASSEWSSSHQPFNAFDDRLDTYGWVTKAGVTTGWLQYEFPTPQVVSKYTITAREFMSGESPKNWTFEAYDGTNWVILDTRSNVTGWSKDQKREFTFINNTAYTKYRINITANNGYSSYTAIDEMEMMTVAAVTPEAPILSGVPGDNSNTLTWTTVDNATGYNVKRATTSGGPYTTIANNITEETYTDTEVTNGTTYYYVVSAMNEAGESANSNEVILTPSEQISVPDSPTNLNGIPGDGYVSLTWDAVTNATSYKVKRSTTPSGPFTEVATDITGTTFVDNTVTNGTTYYYVVTAINTAGESGNSNEVAVTPTNTTPTGDRAVLIITMTNGNIKEYDLSVNQLNDFLSWYEDQADRNGNRAYMFDKGSSGAYTSRTEYIAFRHISSFEVLKYNQ